MTTMSFLSPPPPPPRRRPAGPGLAIAPASPVVSIFSIISESSETSHASSSSSSNSSAMRLRGQRLINGFDKLVVPKARRPKFDLDLLIHDLNNVPVISGTCYIKWHLESSTRSLAHGQTERAGIKDHKVIWNYNTTAQDVRLTIGRNNILQPQNLILRVFQEYPGVKDRIMLGTVTLNLAEYAGMEGVTRRYLLMNSKINSTVKVTIGMNQTGGDYYYETPPLKGAQVFSNIATIMGNDTHQGPSEPVPRIPAALSLINREPTQAQDVYRHNLTASWQLQDGELNADECIEDIFSGGDGWVSPNSSSSRSTNNQPTSGDKSPKFVRVYDPSEMDQQAEANRRRESDKDSDSIKSAESRSSASTPTMTLAVPKANGRRSGVQKNASALVPGRSPLGHIPEKLSLARKPRKTYEVDEMELRDEFVSWTLPERCWT